MSLYVGHLSPRVQPDELERIFRRFGRCSFQLKDGYGFVVYEVTANAERALRALRGKQVCGEQISLSWSNKQPRPFQRPTRGSRFDEPYRRRVFREEGNSTGFRNSQDQRDFSTDVPLPAYNHGRRRVDGAPDKEEGRTHEVDDSVRGNKGEDLTDVVVDDEDTGELNSLEHDRWGEPTRDMLPVHGVGKGSEFDRYEPYHGYNKRGEKEGNRRGSSDSSPYRGLHGKGHKEHFIVEAERKFDKFIPHLTCYNCGQAGHIKRKCPEGDGMRDGFTKFEQIRDELSFRDKVEGRLKKLRTNSWGRPSTSRDPFVSRRRAWDRKELLSNNDGKSPRTRSSPKRREKHRSKLRSNSQTKKGTKKKYSSKKRAEKKRRARISDTSSTSSDSSKSSSEKSKSRSISDTRSHSTSTAASSRSGSASSRSRSISISSYTKSKSSRSKSRSMSRQRSWSTPHGSLSLSISLGQKSSSSPKNKKIHNSITVPPMKENSEHVASPESKPFSKMSNSWVKTSKDESALSPLGVKKHPNVEYSGKNSGNPHKSDVEVGYNETYPCYDVLNGAASASENFPETSTRQGAHLMKPVKQLSDSTMISTGEMLSALRHYGLVSPKEDEPDVTVESYLGAARLWPWEMIYYRRLKRGPISTENYAKRLEQNKEFGIVDKYIRSSSGWGERQKDT